MMIHSLEMRWFFREAEATFPWNDLFEDVHRQDWRTDWYAYPCDPGCGVKIREGKLQTKLRKKNHGVRAMHRVRGRLEEWLKWDAEFTAETMPPRDLLRATGWVAVEKDRYLRIFMLEEEGIREETDPEAHWWKGEGIQLEWTQLAVDGIPWWTLGLETFGPSHRMSINLEQVIQFVFGNRSVLPGLSPERSFGYAEFLSRR